MAKRPTVTTISSGYASNTQLNSNFTAIRNAFDNTLSLDGSTPNAMLADLDLNGNALLNVGNIDADNLTLNGQTVTELSSVPEWRSAWLTGTSYVKNDLVSEAGNSYICLVAHTAGTFATDLTALKWELFAQKGAAGAGTGDMVGSNNLSDVTNVATARVNLGLGTVATESTVPVAKGGTGATDAATARTNLGLGSLATASSITTTEIAAATLVTASETIASNDNDTTIPTSAAVKAYADSVGGSVLLGTINTTSGTNHDFTGIPAGVTEIEVVFRGASLSGTDNILVQLGTSGGFVSTGYNSYNLLGIGGSSSSGSSTAGMIAVLGNAAYAITGTYRLVRSTANTWTGTISGFNTANSLVWDGGGDIALAAALTQVRITRTGSNTFDAGTVAVKYR